MAMLNRGQLYVVAKALVNAGIAGNSLAAALAQIQTDLMEIDIAYHVNQVMDMIKRDTPY